MQMRKGNREKGYSNIMMSLLCTVKAKKKLAKVGAIWLTVIHKTS